MSYAQHTFLGKKIVVRAPETAREVLEYLHTILPKSQSDLASYVFESSRWADHYCVDYDVDLDGLFKRFEAAEIATELVLLCSAIVEAAKTPRDIAEGLELIYSRSYVEPDDERTKKEIGPIFEGVSVAAINFAALTNTIREFGAEILQAPYWVFDALSIRYTHDLKRDRAQRQKAADIKETARINAEVFG